MTIILRPAVAFDLPRIHALDHRLFPPDIAFHIETFALCLADPHSVIFVAEDPTGTLAGFAIFTFYGDHELSVESVDVDEAFQRRGVGRRLMEAGRTLATERGANEMTLQVDAADEGAQAFYRSLGYRPVGLLKGYYNERKDAVEMILTLS